MAPGTFIFDSMQSPLLMLDVFLGKRPPEGKWFPYEDWRGRGWNELNEYEIIDFDKKFNLIKVRRVI